VVCLFVFARQGLALHPIDRRYFLGLPLAGCANRKAASASTPAVKWRGFNLQEKFTDRPDEWATMDPEWGRHNERFVETDFEWMAHWGFNFVRLPMSYRCWTDPNDPYRLFERTLKEIDQAVHWGRQYGLHVCINFHRAPGFCINWALSPEPWNLWTDAKALDIFTFQWHRFAERYKGIPGDQLSFNLVNEPNRCTATQYARTMRSGVQAIRSADPNRLVMIDGLFGEAMLPVVELATLPHAVHSTRGYAPFKLSHYLAPWAGKPTKLPTWPLLDGIRVEWNTEVLNRWCVRPWVEFQQLGARIFVGEWGCWNRTPHQVTLAWMRDFLSLWKQNGWGWALWCFRGSFGILDSNRADVRYENWRGRKLDRRMLELLQEF
jgi:endoglucanase